MKSDIFLTAFGAREDWDEQSLSEAHRLAGRLRASGVWINVPGVPGVRLPRGGLKTSGIGREPGWAGIEGNTEEKTVTITF